MDNGCAASTTYVASPSFQDTNFAFDTAESGQLPASPTALQIAQRNTWLHTVGQSGATTTMNLPGIDYPIGPQTPSTLRGIYNWNTDHPSSPCVYATTGGPYGGGPYLNCTANTNVAGQMVTISGYDFSNTGNGTGTGCAELYIQGTGTFSGTNYTYIIQNDYFQANLEGTQSNTNYCWTGSSDVGGVGAIISVRGTAVVGAQNIYFYNVEIDGNTNTAVADGISPANYRVYAFADNREGPTQPYGSTPPVFYYSVVINMGHIATLGSNSTGYTAYYSYNRNNCISGQNYCHGEWAEMDGGQQLNRYDTFVGDVYVVDSIYGSGNNGSTTMAYMTTGTSNNVGVASGVVEYSLVVGNNTNCTNQGPPTYPITPYSPNNQCGGTGTGLSAALVSTARDSFVTSLTLVDNVVDGTGAADCATNETNMHTPVTPITASASSGNQLNITVAASNYGLNQNSNLFAGMTIEDTNVSDGFTPTTISALTPSYVNASTGAASIGTLTLTNNSEPTLSGRNTWDSYATITTLTESGNWSIGGAYATRQSAGGPQQLIMSSLTTGGSPSCP